MKYVHRHVAFLILVCLVSCSRPEPKTNCGHTEGLAISDVNYKKVTTTRLKPLERKATLKVEAKIVQEYSKSYTVSPILPGKLKEIHISSGWVKQGQLLAELESPRFLEIKKEYLEARNEFKFQKQQFARQGELAIEQATSIKKMKAAESAYNRAEINLEYMKRLVQLLGYQAEAITYKSLNAKARLEAPVSGLITDSFLENGAFCPISKALYKISSGKESVVVCTLPNWARADEDKLPGFPLIIEGAKFDLESYSVKSGQEKSQLHIRLQRGEKLPKQGEMLLELPLVYKVIEIDRHSVFENSQVILKKDPDLFEVYPLGIIKQHGQLIEVRCDSVLLKYPIVSHGLNYFSNTN